MKVTITSIELKGSLKFFALSGTAMKIIRQLRATKCLAFKKKGFWTTHYTMTLWKSEQDLKDFALSGPHLEAMKLANTMATEIRTATIDSTGLPTWKEAIRILKGARVIRYS